MRDDELDRLIDAGLNTYADPRAGLENRVLAAVAADAKAAARRPVWRVWAIALGAAACLLIAVLVGMRFAKTTGTNKEEVSNSVHAPAAPRTTAQTMRSVAPLRVETRRSVRKEQELRVRRLPKQRLFPSPQPLSAGMRALVEFGARAPENERQALLQAVSHVDVPLNIEPLHVAPLNNASKDGD